jgi:hypothetical protein
MCEGRYMMKTLQSHFEPARDEGFIFGGDDCVMHQRFLENEQPKRVSSSHRSVEANGKS